ncbi:3-oxoacyl-[acyl-carrier-protein] synthase II [Deinobacterium chartae]|uniref:3-oxoacyl-[acyl-carrier-protein] synthase 2 n=1 Tax=Deinobacterium chartae TaxID=521158 RepID=A0A841I352_9DEIO|nr:beta-ketoacyl-ACP synthase II [Deinobacterium chartae]MBB6100097.1 3-oxoacyl-[acyl-carrier-protein] synthase II [Deinobacterium chartae]
MKRVVITGLGPVTPIGLGAEAFKQAQRAGKSGVKPITRFDASHIACRIAAQVDDDLSPWVDPKEARRIDRFVQLALAGTALAAQDAGLSDADLAGERVGTLVGSGIGGMQTWEETSQVYVSRGANRISPFFIPMMIANMASGQIAMRYGSTGPSNTVVTACATGGMALGEAMRLIQLGEADIMITGGSEATVTPMAMGGFSSMKALSTRNDEPEKASRPFTASRDGFVLGEGAGIVILEELEHALKRGAHIHAELVGYATSADAFHMTMPAPEGRGAAQAMRRALRSAGVNPEQIGYVNAHGTSTPANDLTETQAIKSVFGEHARKLAVSSTKSMTGHLLGAAGAVEAIAVAQALEDGILPPTINYDDPDPELDLDYIPNAAREQQVEYAISNSFAFGGQNAVLVFKRFS